MSDRGDREAERGEAARGEAAASDERRGAAPAVSDATVVVPDETIVVAAAAHPIDETVAIPASAAPADVDATVVTPRDPAPPVRDPAERELSPELAKRMFKPALSARHRVQRPPTEAPAHTRPRPGVSPAIPVVSPTRSGRTVAGATGVDLTASLGPRPEFSPLPPAAEREGLRSQARAHRSFGRVVVLGFTASIVVAALGLWWITTLLFA